MLVWWLPWEQWIPWGKLPQIPLGLYFLYVTYAAFHIYGCHWAVLISFGFAIGFLINGFLQRPNP
jgi:hypothetical protein